jgi:hypothetical protein
VVGGIKVRGARLMVFRARRRLIGQETTAIANSLADRAVRLIDPLDQSERSIRRPTPIGRSF